MYISFLNSILRSVQKRHPGRLLYYPTKVSIETGNICNLRCPLCPTGDENADDAVKGFLSLPDFKIIFDKIKPFVKTVDLFNWGEPFLNREISGMIKYARESKPDLRMFIDSNFNIVSDEQLDSVVRNGLDVLKISCDGVSQEIYEKYRVGGNIRDVLDNIKRLLAKKEELGSDRPHVIWKYLVFKHNRHEVEKAREFADELGIGFEASGMRVDCGREIFEKIEESVDRDREWIPDDPEYNNYDVLEKTRDFCVKPWRTLTVNWNGDVVPCGAIYDCGTYSFGNLLRESFDEIWNGKRFLEARKIINGKAGGTDVVCSICKANGYQFF